MRTTILIVLLASAAGPAPQTRARWTVPHLESEARRLAVQARTDWSAVVRLMPAAPIVLTRLGRLPEPRHFLVADDTEIVVLNTGIPGLPGKVRRVLLKMASERVEYARLFRDELFFADDNVRVTAGGVFASGQKIVETTEVIERIRRADVLVVAEPPTRHGSALGAIIGTGGGFLLGFSLAVGIGMENQCGRSCSDEGALMALSAVGLPIAGGLLGYRAISRTTQAIIYEAGTNLAR